MVKVKVSFFAAARDAVGASEAQCSGATVSEVLDDAVSTFGPALANLLPYCLISVDDAVVQSRSQPVAPGAEVGILPPVSGG